MTYWPVHPVSTRYKAISYNKLILKTENGGFSTFAGEFDPGTGRIGPAVFKFRLAFSRDASNRIRVRILKNISQNQFRMPQFHPKKWPIFRINSIRKWFWGNCVVSKKKAIMKKRPTPLDASRKKASRNLKTAGPILPVPGSNTPAKVLKPPFSVFRISLL